MVHSRALVGFYCSSEEEKNLRVKNNNCYEGVCAHLLICLQLDKSFIISETSQNLFIALSLCPRDLGAIFVKQMIV